jgi:hypothetical protein
MLNALFVDRRMTPAADGTVTLKQLADAMVGAGLDPSQLGPLRAIAALGSGGFEGLVTSNFGTDDQHRVDLGYHLLDGVLGHAGDSGVLGEPPGPRAERFEALIAHAEERVAADGRRLRVMTPASYLRALDARADGPRAHEGSASKGRFFGALEAQLIPSLFGEITVEQLRALYFEGRIPPPAPDQKALGALFPEILRRVPSAFAADVRRAMKTQAG